MGNLPACGWVVRSINMPKSLSRTHYPAPPPTPHHAPLCKCDQQPRTFSIIFVYGGGHPSCQEPPSHYICGTYMMPGSSISARHATPSASASAAASADLIGQRNDGEKKNKNKENKATKLKEKNTEKAQRKGWKCKEWKRKREICMERNFLIIIS